MRNLLITAIALVALAIAPLASDAAVEPTPQGDPSWYQYFVDWYNDTFGTPPPDTSTPYGPDGSPIPQQVYPRP